MKYDIVIAGGGFGGAYCARELARKLSSEGARRVALVAEENVFTFQPMLAEVAGSSLSPFDVVNPLRLFCRGISVLRGTVRGVNWEKKALELDGGRFTPDCTIEFDQLVLALGSVVDFSKVPGLAQHGLPMKTVADALRLRSAVINRLEEANLTDDKAAKRRLLTFVVVGGGYTGVETAGQLLDFLKAAQDYYQNLKDEKIRVVLVHSRGHLLAEIGEKLGDYAQHVLESRGMEVLLNARVVEAAVDRAVLGDGSSIETHTIISTVGNAPHPAILDLCKQLGVETIKGRVPVDEFLRVKGQEKLWAIGDCAAVPYKDDFAPPTAQFALREGTQLGRNLARLVTHEALEAFHYKDLGQLATVGERAAVAEVMGFHFSGFIAWWMWRTIYLAKLPGLVRKLRVMVDWTFELFFPRDVSLLIPPPLESLRPLHFSGPARLFPAGAHARGIVLIERGKITTKAADGTTHDYGPGEILDGDLLDEHGNWKVEANVMERTDVLLIRGTARDLVNQLRMQLKPQNPPNTVEPTASK